MFLTRVVGSVVAASLLFAGGTSLADTIYVPDDYETIQGAIDAAVDGDEIAVRSGTYNEAINFLGKAVRLYSTDGAEVTVIDAEREGTVVRCVTGEEPDTILEGFTITGGNGGGMYNEGSSPTVTNCTFSGNTGGGMSNNARSSPTVTNCTFSGNTAVNGGGMTNWESSSPTVTDCTFSRNLADMRGGGMRNYQSSPTVTNCTFSGNWAGIGGGMENNSRSSPTVTNCTFSGNEAVGGGMSNDESSPTVTNCVFSGNYGRGSAGGMLNDESSPTVMNCVFSGNTASVGAGMRNSVDSNPTVTNCTFSGNTGGGMSNNARSSPTVTNCTFSRNTMDDWGGGMHNAYASSPTVTNCTFSGNTARLAGGGMQNGLGCNPMLTNCTFIANMAGNGRAIASDDAPSNLNLVNCILWNGGDEIWYDNESTIVVTYSDIQGGYEGVGNIDADPLCDEDGRPQAGSPCIDAGANNAVPADTFDLDNDGDTAERLPLDLDGNPRFADDLDRDDTGCGLPVVVDMGAFEYQGVPVHPVLVGDVDGDGAVGMTDVVDVLMAWGECDPECCLADVDSTWRVDTEDLMLVLANWG